ncbi:transcriptional regulator [Microbacterium marinilacus]|uniref:GAF domain-containing protein n=1 Tax=Microbacterium marinilacus TaxID=415209 RepID=A0ABP7BUW6_9MICO|nr:transcriptional regulator [Microbacterium marinilacus]MBY0689039.1 transcriptional regulator [Microbacterium marinilacus]
MASTWVTGLAPLFDAPRSLLERAHDELIAGNLEDPRLQLVRPLVRDSWGRSIARLVGAEALPPLDLDGAELERYRAEHPLAASLPLIRQLLLPGGAEDAGVVLAVGDASGRLLWVEGDAGVRALVDGMGFSPGANWAEDRAGTAAPGTALALGRTVQIRGAEHFNRLVHPWSCTASPVRDPETRRIIGIIDVTGGDAAVSPQAQLAVDATVRAVEGELLIGRLRAREEVGPRRIGARRSASRRPVALGVLGRDRAVTESTGPVATPPVELGLRHSEILLMLATHPHGLTAERLAELVYGTAAVATLRPEMVRLRRRLERDVPGLRLESRPYRLVGALETDAQHVLALIDRGAHRLALAAYRGDVLPDSQAPGVAELRETLRLTLRDALVAEASVDVLLHYTDSDVGADDVEALRQCLALLPPRSPRRAGLVARLERLESDA